MGYIIYKICSDDCDFVYIGSTKNFTKRKSKHKSDCDNENGKSYNFKLYQTIRDNKGWDNWRMVCVEELGDITKRQAEMREEEWRLKLKANLNMVKSYQTEEQMKEYNKEYRDKHKEKAVEYKKKWYENNKDKITERRKEYRENNKGEIRELEKTYRIENKDKLLEKKKEYYEQNKDKLLEKMKEYYEQNRDKIIEKMKEKIVCECGCVSTIHNLARHKKTKKHQAWEWRQTLYTE